MIYGNIKDYDGQTLYITAPFTSDWLLEKQGISDVELRLIDGRSISADQRKKAYALMRDISDYTGHTPEEIKHLMKYDFIASTASDDFSLSDCDMTTARLFIDHMVEFCLLYDIPCVDSLLDRAEDIGRYLYLCMVHKKCCICGKPAEIHHAEDRVGMGRNRNEISHVGMRAMALCGGVQGHHDEAHVRGQQEFNRRYHVFGIALDDFLCKKLKLGRYANGD